MLRNKAELFEFTCGEMAAYFTDCDFDLTGTALPLYKAAAIERGDISHNNEDNSLSLSVKVASDNEIAVLFKRILPATPVLLTVREAPEPENGLYASSTRLIWRGNVVSAEFFGGECTLTCISSSSELAAIIPSKLFQSTCQHAVYSKTELYVPEWFPPDYPYAEQKVGCNADKSAFSANVTLASVDGLTLFSPAFSGQPDGYFAGGVVEFAGESRYIESHFRDSITITYPFLSAPAALDDVVVVLGCDGTRAMCKSRFNNEVNFFGFDRIPSRNPFTSGL